MKDPAPSIPFQPIAEYQAHAAELDAALRRVAASGMLILGPEVAAFEREFAGYLGAAHAVGVASGTDAIELALRALEIGPGDTVATVSHTAVATVAAIRRTGAEALLVDIEPATFTMDPRSLAAAIEGAGGRRLRAVIPVHLYGHPADMASILDLARRHGLRVVEDCAQAHGARIGGRRVGTWGDLAAFSFYPTKNLAALGDGGAVVTGDPRLAARVRELRQYGWVERYVSEREGINSRLDELQAALLRVKLVHLDRDNARRRALAARYDAGLAGADVETPLVRAGCEPVYHQYVVRSARRDALLAHLRARGLPAAVHYPMAVHQQPAYRGRLPVVAGGLPATERAVAEVLSLPLHAYLPDAAIDTVIGALKECAP